MNQEANRCLQCKNPLCVKGCPIKTNIPYIISLYKSGNTDEAKQALFLNNPFSSVCSIICDHKGQCNGHCVLAIKGEGIRFYEIENELSIPYLDEVHFDKPISNNKKVAIVGAGPAGLTCALLLGNKGYEVTLYEANEDIGGVLRYGIPDFRLSKDIVDKYHRFLNELNINLITNTRITSIKDLKSKFDDVILCIGVEKPKGLNIPGENLDNAIYAIDYLKNPTKYKLGNKVIVIGGGNVAIDASRTAIRSNHDTYIYYRKTFENMPATPAEVEEAKTDGVKFEMFNAPLEIKDNGIIFAKTENIVDQNNKVQTKIIENTEHFVPCDNVIIAVSQALDTSVIDDDTLLNNWKLIDVNEDGLTKVDGIYACGDSVTGAKTVVHAVEAAKKVVNTIIEKDSK